MDDETRDILCAIRLIISERAAYEIGHPVNAGYAMNRFVLRQAYDKVDEIIGGAIAGELGIYE